MGRYENLERVVCKELEKLDSAYEGKNEFTKDDAEKFRMLAHAWKCLLTAEAMHEADSMEGASYARGRNGRYMSRDMNPGYSGHYPPPYYNEGRYW